MYGIKAMWKPDQQADESDFGVVSHKIRMYKELKQDLVSPLYEDTTSKAIYQTIDGAIVDLHVAAKKNSTLQSQNWDTLVYG